MTLFSPTKRRLHHIVKERVREKVLEPASTPSLDLVSFVNPTQVTQETSHKESDIPTKGGATTIKNARNLNENHMMIGVDEESKYSDTDFLVALSDSSYDTDMVASSDSDPEYDIDDEILDDDDEIITFSYDVDDQCIDVGRVFTDVK
jgi:hypothetical protein